MHWERGGGETVGDVFGAYFVEVEDRSVAEDRALGEEGG
jgi:hypothetical protein